MSSSDKMSLVSPRLLYNILIVLCVSIQNGKALRVEAVPESLDATIDKELNITCIVENSSDETKDIVTIEITKKNQRAIVLLRRGQIYSGPNMKPHMQGEGEMKQGADLRFLRLTIKNPGVEDAGTYICRMFYLDANFAMTEIKAYRNVTMNKLDPVVTYLMDKVSAMEQEQHIMAETIERQDSIISQQGKQLKSHQEQLKEHDSRHAYTVAFYAAYDPKDKIKSGEKVVFSNTIVNIGDAYDFSTGVFTTPKAGLYLFYLSAALRQKDAWIFIDLRVNYHHKGGVSTRTDKVWDQTSISILLKLEEGDEVITAVRLLRNTDILTLEFSTFGGHLIKLL